MKDFQPSPTDVVFIGGRWMRDVDRTISEEKFKRLYEGYQCLACDEPFIESFPEVCPLIGCGYEPRKNQRRDIEHAYRGVDIEWDDLLRRIDAPTPPQEIAKKTGIWIPDWSSHE